VDQIMEAVKYVDPYLAVQGADRIARWSSYNRGNPRRGCQHRLPQRRAAAQISLMRNVVYGEVSALSILC
jgi:hypothetical protein